MEKEKLDKVKKEILKSGIPTEIEVSSFLRKDGWFVVNQDAYLDEDEKKVRAIDISAMKGKANEAIILLCECKKSEGHAWAFYTHHKKADIYAGLLSFVETLRVAQHIRLGFDDDQQKLKSHFSDMNVKVGTIGRVLFKKKDDFFEALQQVLKALAYNKKKFKIPDTYFFAYPVIIFDGQIYEFDIKDDEEVEIKPIAYLQFIGTLKEEKLRPCLVDVVKKSYFPEYLSLVNKEFES